MVAAGVVGLAFAVRLAWILLVPTRPVGDFAMYLESAAHLVQHGALDSEFVYMPGYVILLALVQELGGGVLAAKIVGAALASLGVGAVYEIARHAWDQRAAVAAGLLAAVWPGGVVVASVTGTDMPAAALVALAVAALLRWGRQRSVQAALLFGAMMGLAAWIRAVALPLAALAAVYFWAVGAAWRRVARETTLAVLAAALLLAPWAARNQQRYGELFLTDSHGGLTALVGANPNTEGAYSRSLNRMFEEITGFVLLAEPHRQADKAAYAIARAWTQASPLFALGLVALKAERLLDGEGSLLYWPVYRAGVLDPERASWFAQHRAGLESLLNGFWYALVLAWVIGLVVAAAQRRWVLWSLVPMQLALVAIYALFFAEVRYHLPIALLMFPAAGVAVAEVLALVRRQDARVAARHLGLGAACALVVVFTWRALLAGGEVLRARHRFAVSVCHVAGEARFCLWRDPNPGPSGVRGIWDGVGALVRVGENVLAETSLTLPPGQYRLRATLDVARTDRPRLADTSAVVRLAGGDPMPLGGLAENENGLALDQPLHHAGGELRVELRSEGARATGGRVWLSRLRIEKD